MIFCGGSDSGEQKSPEHDFEYLYCTMNTILFPNLFTANPTWGVIFESSKLKARTSLLPRFSEKRNWSFEL